MRSPEKSSRWLLSNGLMCMLWCAWHLTPRAAAETVPTSTMWFIQSTAELAFTSETLVISGSGISCSGSLATCLNVQFNRPLIQNVDFRVDAAGCDETHITLKLKSAKTWGPIAGPLIMTQLAGGYPVDPPIQVAMLTPDPAVLAAAFGTPYGATLTLQLDMTGLSAAKLARGSLTTLTLSPALDCTYTVAMGPNSSSLILSRSNSNPWVTASDTDTTI